MFIKTILETYIDITDPNDIFSNNLDKMLFDKLTSKFVGVCYNSCLIIKVNKIIRRSYMYMKDTLDGDAHTNIMFEVDAIQYIKDEIINGCKIIKKESNGIVHAKSEYAGIQLNIPATMSIFKEDDIIPVIIKMVRYNVNQSAISVLAVPFIPTVSPVVYYKLNDILTKQENENIKTLIEQVKNEENKIDKLNTNEKKIYNFFVDLLSNKQTAMKSGKKFNISDVLNIKTGIVWKPNIGFDTPDIYHSAAEIKEEPQDGVINESQFISFSTMLIRYLSNLQTLQEFLKYYPKFTDIQNNKNIWRLYSSLKK